jgi:hypothetical protein
MIQSVVAALPVESSLVPSHLESIIDKKIAGIALNLIERLLNWIFSWIYFPYNRLYQAKMARVHRFRDNITPLLDCTKQGIARIDFNSKNDYISLLARKVHFKPIPHIDITFSRETFTEYVAIIDDENRGPGWYKIVEQEAPHPGNQIPMEKQWLVNTNQPYQVERWIDPVFLAELPF